MNNNASNWPFHYYIFNIILCFIAAQANIFATEIPAMPIKVAKAVTKDIPVTLEGAGHLNPLSAINIKSRINGRLEKSLIKDGAIVKKGQPLFEIDTAPYLLAVNQAEATLKKEEANLVENTKLIKISTNLFSKQVIAKVELDKVQASAEEAKASVDEAKATLEIAKQNLKYCKITAPIDGMLGRKLISKGSLISAYTDVIITLNDIKTFKVIFSLPSKYFPDIKKQHNNFPLKITIYNPEDDNIQLNGLLNYIGNEIDTKTGMLEVQGIVENKGYNFWPGEFVKVVLTLTTKPDSIIIPARALINSTDNSKIVYIINNNTAQPRPVKVGWLTNDKAVILAGIKDGEVVATEGLFKLYPGAKVTITSETTKKYGENDENK